MKLFSQLLILALVLQTPGLVFAQTSTTKTARKTPIRQSEKIEALTRQVNQLESLQSNATFALEPFKSILAKLVGESRCKRDVAILMEAVGASPLEGPTKKELESRSTNVCLEQLSRQQSLEQAIPKASNLQLEGCELQNQLDFAPSVPMPTVPLEAQKPIVIAKDFPEWTVQSLDTTGDQVLGPVNVVFRYLNPLRFDQDLGAAVSFKDAPAYPPGLLPTFTPASTGGLSPGGGKLSAATSAPQSRKAPQNATGFRDVFEHYTDCYQIFEANVSSLDATLASVLNGTRTATGKFTAVLNALKGKRLERVIPKALIDDTTVFGNFSDYSWPVESVATFSRALDKFIDRYHQLSTRDDYAAWIKGNEGNKDEFKFLSDRLEGFRKHLVELEPNGDMATKLATAQDSVRFWRARFRAVASLDDAAYSKTYLAACDDLWQGKSKSIAVKLISRDLMAPTPVDETTELVTVNCLSTLSITAGMGFTTLGDRVPAFVPDPNDTAKLRLGFSSHSAIRPLYALQINSSVWPFRKGIELHASLGAALANSTDTGSTLGFTIGPSVSFRRRTVYLTPALHFGQESVFQTGFAEGSPKASLSAVPTRTHWKPALTFIVSFPVAGK
jgi:hypothetical protein